MSRLRYSAVAAALALAVALQPTAAAATECLTRQLPRPTEDFATIKARLEAAGQWHRSGDPTRTPPPDPQVGDTWSWYVWDLGGFPVANRKPATVRGMGDHCYVVVDDEEWNVGMDQADVDRIVQHFNEMSVGPFPEQGIWDLNTAHFGDPPNPLDDLERIFLFYYRFDIASDGFFWVYDQFPDGSQPFASNECDVVYLAVDSGQPASDYMLGVAAHEFEHMIHYNQDADEVSWVDEGLAELAMWLYGHPDTISAFNSQPDNNLTNWTGAWADYIKTYLWTLYVYEQYGGQPTIWDLVHNPANSMTGYQSTLQNQGHLVLTQDVFRDWGVANFLDDPDVPDGEYGYVGEDLPPFTAFRTVTTYPTVGSSSAQPHGTDYIRLQNFNGAPTVGFDGADAREFRVTLMAIDPDLPTLVEMIPLDAAQAGSVTFTGALGYEQVVMAIANVSLSGSGVYNYTFEESTTAIEDVLAARTTLGAHPNPFNPRTSFAFTLAHEGDVALTVHDARGVEVARLVGGRLAGGAHEIPWHADGVAAGVYLGRLTVDGREIATSKVTVLK